ncbi:hypothetical protein IE53DRAFT_385391 [Violaceomyces palustris]|uniref:Uncharacterized protein n=1 Tax=Violaceomyces palustris TaxID=1673888 RepID=A0ACD0P253_9BASI|nr:hypothetical protein IE53DRAFT_385391 [Violaceomyces palustris]
MATQKIGARTRDLVFQGVNIPTKPSKTSARGLFHQSMRLLPTLMPTLSPCSRNFESCVTDRPGTFILLAILGSLWHNQAEVRQYGIQLWHFAFRTMWASSVFQLGDAKFMAEGMAAMLHSHLFSLMTPDDLIFELGMHAWPTGCSMALDHSWRRMSVSAASTPGREVLGAWLEQGEATKLDEAWRSWCEAEEKNRLCIGSGILESQQAPFSREHTLVRLRESFCQALEPAPDSLWEAPSAEAWARMVVEGELVPTWRRKQMGTLVDELVGVADDEKDGERPLQESASAAMERLGQFGLYALLEGLHGSWLARHQSPYKSGSVMARCFHPFQEPRPTTLTSSSTYPSSSTGCTTMDAYRMALIHPCRPPGLERILGSMKRWMELWRKLKRRRPPPTTRVFDGPETKYRRRGSGDVHSLHLRWHSILLDLCFSVEHVEKCFLLLLPSSEDEKFGSAGGGSLRRPCRLCTNEEERFSSAECPLTSRRRRRRSVYHSVRILDQFSRMNHSSIISLHISQAVCLAFSVLCLVVWFESSCSKGEAEAEGGGRFEISSMSQEEEEEDFEFELDSKILFEGLFEQPPLDDEGREEAIRWVRKGDLTRSTFRGSPFSSWPEVLRNLLQEIKVVQASWHSANRWLEQSKLVLDAIQLGGPSFRDPLTLV